jgi:hypothetical protein
MAEQGDRRTRVRLPYQRGEVGEIVLELADIADIAAGTGSAMTADVGCKGLSASACTDALEPEEP